MGRRSKGEWKEKNRRKSRDMACVMTNGPIRSHWQLFSWMIMGPFAVIGNFVYWQQWAHSWPLAIFIMGSNGPICSHRQLFSWVTMGPFAAIGNFSHGWLWAHSERSMTFLIGWLWAHLQSSATLFVGSNGPICSYRQFLSWAAMGPFGALDNFSHRW